MDIGVSINARRNWLSIVQIAKRLDQIGISAVYFSDHLIPHEKSILNDGHNILSCWNLLCGLAQHTENIKLGSLVSPVSFYSPAVLAKQILTADAMAPNRIVVGLGCGWQANEFKLPGLRLKPFYKRVKHLAEAAPLINELINSKNVTHSGEIYNCSNLTLNKRLGNSIIPIVIGGTNDQILNIALAHNFRWSVISNIEMLDHYVYMYKHGFRSMHGIDPTKLDISLKTLVTNAPGVINSEFHKHLVVSGSSRETRESLYSLYRSGISEVVLVDIEDDQELFKTIETLQSFSV